MNKLVQQTIMQKLAIQLEQLNQRDFKSRKLLYVFSKHSENVHIYLTDEKLLDFSVLNKSNIKKCYLKVH